MTHKVLVFESDAAFASELRNELGKLGCQTAVVDDGNVGLQQAASERPDLILLSIELPRMNGFSVCNKLKKDPGLKDVPLIIMSSESSDETFDQHRKLRTRAEDYVHKPIAFGELLQHIQSFVQIGDEAATGEADAVIIIDDEEEASEDDDAGTQMMQRPAFPAPSVRPAREIDPEIDSFADAAFGMLTGSPSPPNAHRDSPKGRNGSAGAASEAPPPMGSVPPSMPPAAVAPPVVAAPTRQSKRSPPAAAAAPAPQAAPAAAPIESPRDTAEVDRLRAELERVEARAGELEKGLNGAKSEVARLQDEAQHGAKFEEDSQRLQREVDELKTKLAGAKPAAGGGVSSREFLDLREALNKKDKEILSLKEALTKKDKEIYEGRDKSLVLERGKQELDDKVLATEREMQDAREKLDALVADKEQAKKVGEDLKVRLGRAQAETELRARELGEARDKQVEENAAHEAVLARAKQDFAAAMQTAAAEKTIALEETESEYANATEALKAAQEAALAEARMVAARERAEAVQTREGELRQEADSKLAALHRAHQDDLARAKADFEKQTEQARALHAGELLAADSRRVDDVARANSEAADRLESREDELQTEARKLVADYTSKIETLEADRDARIAGIERERDARITGLERERDARITGLEKERDSRIAALENDRDTKIAALENDRDTKIADLESDRDARIAAIENDRDSRVAALESRSARELAETRAVADAHKAASDEQIRGLSEDLRDLGAKNTGNEARIVDLEQQLASMTASRDTNVRELKAANARIATLDKDLADTQSSLADTRTRLDAETTRANKAVAKWDNDKASLERAKDALAVALSQIEETGD